MASTGGQSTDNARVVAPEVPTTAAEEAVEAVEAVTGVREVTVASLKTIIRNSAMQFQHRNYMWPPEMCECQCDLHTLWADKLLDDNEPEIALLIKSGTEEDFRMLIEEVFTEDIWKGSRRAFFSALHVRARRCDEMGVNVSAALVRFYRNRYHPTYWFVSERW